MDSKEENSVCVKCGHEEVKEEKFGQPLCAICNHFAPKDENTFSSYIQEKISSQILDTFRNSSSHGENLKKGMIKKASQGKTMSRAAFGYKIEKGELIPAENYKEVEEIFEEFLSTKVSLRQLSRNHNFSVNGLKKILTNFTYIGKVKFNGEIHPGNHQAILSTTMFNHVQNKLMKLGIKRY